MKKMKKLAIGIVLLSMLALIMSISAFADYSGRDGDIIWSVDTTHGVLTVEGSGAIATYSNGKAPWYDYNSYVKSIVVKNGITSISKGAFYGMDYVNSLTVPFVGQSGSANTFIGYIFGSNDFYANNKYLPETLKSISITNATSIASYAFNDCENLEEVILGDKITTISSYAFKNCLSLKSIVIGSSITSIGTDAFQNCSALTKVFYNSTSSKWSSVSGRANVATPVCLADGTLSATAPSKSTYKLGEKFNTSGITATFNSKDVTKDVKITLPDMSSIGTKTYTVTYGVLSVTGQITVTANETSGVAGAICWSFNEATGELVISGEGIMDNYTLEILPPWYKYRNNIKTVTVSSGVKSVGDYAFYAHTSLKKVTVPETVKSIGYAAFEGCYVLDSVSLGNIYAPVDATAFRGCDALVVTDNGNEYLSISGNSRYMLKSVGDKTVTAFSIPETTVVIGEGAFKDCTGITSLTIPNSVVSIGDSAFKGCTSLKNVKFGLLTALIGNSAFEDCTALTDVIFTSTPKSIGVLAFASCPLNTTTDGNAKYIGSVSNPYMILLSATSTDITSCALNPSTQIISALAFANCKMLVSVTLNDGLKNISASAFNGCNLLYSVDIPNTVVSIGSLAFSDCTNLGALDLGTGVEIIGNGAFRGATSLESVSIPLSVNSVGYNAFRGCTSLKTVGVSNGVKSIGYKTFEGCTKLVNVYLPNSLYSIGDYAFKGCSALKSLAVPYTTTAIGYGAFYYCNALETMSLPFAGEKANGNYPFLGYVFGATEKEDNALMVPKTLKTILVGSDIGEWALNSLEIDTLIIDKTTENIASGINANNVYYLGTSAGWSEIEGSSAYTVKEFLNNSFTVIDPNAAGYVAGQMIDISAFTAVSGSLDVKPLIRLASNPIIISGNGAAVPVHLGSLESSFRATIEDDFTMGEYRLVLEGSIGVKVYVQLSAYAALNADKINAKVLFMGEEYDATLVKDSDPNNKYKYYVKFYVAAKEMHEDVTLTVELDGVSSTISVSVKGYVDYMNEHSAEFEDSIALANALYTFGEYSRKYFGVSNVNPTPDLTDTTVTVSNNYTPVVVGDVEGINIYSTSLLLESNTTIRHYFKLAKGASIDDYTFVVDGVIDLTPIYKDGYYYVDITNIVAHKLGEMRVLAVSDGTSTAKYVYSPLSYVKLATESASKQSVNLLNLVKALYNYNNEARAYFKLINASDIVPGENESSTQVW